VGAVDFADSGGRDSGRRRADWAGQLHGNGLRLRSTRRRVLDDGRW
jgi:hypothetical protein